MKPPQGTDGFSHGSRNRLTARWTERFPGETLFARLARAVCAAECLPRKELYEAWEVARRARRVMRGGRVVDLAAGHGLAAFALLLLDDSSSEAVCVDLRKPESFARLEQALGERWPRLKGRVRYLEAPLAEVRLEPGDLVVSCHACGTLSDQVLDLCLAARARLALLPCCQDLDSCDTGGLEGWLDGPLAVDAVRACRVRAAGYQMRTQQIPSEITPKNRLLLAWPGP